MLIVVCRADTGQYLYQSSYRLPTWGTDLQKARTFSTKSAATNAARGALCGHYRREYRKWVAKEGAPILAHVPVVLKVAD